MRISVVIPVYEDAEALGRNLPRGFDEVVVVDASREVPVRGADLPPGVRLLRSEVASRAVQMNAGAAEVSGEVLLFLHADTAVPSGAAEAIRQALADPSVVGGGFARRFDHPSQFLAWTCRLAAWRSRRFGWFLGDQAIFVRREDFTALGGYSQARSFEDLDLSRRLKGRGKLRCLELVAVSSGRRFAGGPLRRTLADLGLTFRYLLTGLRGFTDTD